MTLEENVLAYLDGSLDESSSAELLHTLSASPEKRAVLDEHLRLNDMLALGRKPFAVPPGAEQALAARLPALGGAIQSAPLLQPSGFIAGGFRAVQSFFANHAIVTASAAAVALAVAGGLWWNSNRADLPASLTAATPSTSNTTMASSANLPVSNEPSPTITPHFAIAKRTNEVVRIGHPASLILHPSSLADTTSAIGQAEISDAAIPFPGMRAPRTMHEIAFGVPREGVHTYSIGVNMAAGYNYLPQITGTTSAPLLAMEPQVTADFDLSEYLAFGLEAGIGEFGQLSTHLVLDPSIGGSRYTRGLYYSDVTGQSVSYVRSAMHVTIAPASEYPIRLGFAGGVAFESGMQPCAAISAGIARTLSDDITLDLAFVASGIWSNAATDAVSTSGLSSVTGIVHTETSATRTFTSAFGLRAGFRYRP